MHFAAAAFVSALAGPGSATADAAAPPAPLVLRPKAAITTMSSVNHHSAPFVEPLAGMDLELLPRPDERLQKSKYACTGERSLCYDPYSGRIVFKPARALMPEIRGFRPENISIRRDRIVFKYSW